MHSATSSPASTSSADLSFGEEYEDGGVKREHRHVDSSSSSNSTPRTPGGTGSISNIWRFDGEESKSLHTGFGREKF